MIVDRGTLAKVFSASYPASPVFAAKAYTVLKKYSSDTDLAIITTWPSQGWAPAGFSAGEVLWLLTNPSIGGISPLGMIGASSIGLTDADNASTMEHSTLSWIGVHGFPVGSDWERIGGGNYGRGGSAGLDGFLALDNASNYTYVAKAGVPFDLGADNPATAKMAVGGSTYTGALPAGSIGGFAVMVLHAGTLQPYNFADPSAPGSNAPVVFSTRNSDGSANYGASGTTYTGQDGFNGMSLYLEQLQYDKVGEPLLVLIRSIGAPMPEEGLQPENNYQGPYDVKLALAVDRLAFDIASLGGTYQWIIRLATPVANGNQSYSEVGRNHTAEGDTTVAETGSGVSPAPPSTELSGRLERNNLSLFAPVDISGGPAVPDPLLPIVTSEPVAWPLTKTAGQRLGVQCVGEYTQLGSNPRFEYWNLQTSASDWNDTYLHRVRRVTYAEARAEPGCTGLAKPAFSAAQTELKSEFRWMAHLKSYVHNLAAPFGYSGTYAGFAAIDSATEAVTSSLKIPDTTGGLRGFSIFGGILNALADIAGPVTEVVSAAVNVVGDSFGVWSNFSGDSANSAATVFAQRDRVNAEGKKIGDQVAGRLQAISRGSETMTDAIASDYARLANVGTHEGCVPAVQPPQVDPNCPVGWELSQQAVNDTQSAFILSARRAAWNGLLPTAWPYVLYTNSNPGSYGGIFTGPQEQISGIQCGFGDYPFNVTSPAFLRYDFRSDPQSSEGPNTKFMVMTNGNFRGASSRFRFPDPKLLTGNHLFDPVDPEHVNSGPLGMDEYRMLVDDWSYYASSGPTRVNWGGC